MKTRTMNYKTLVAASLMSIALTSAAFAQCSDCAMRPDRDAVYGGGQTPASKMSPAEAAAANAANSGKSANNAHAEAQVHHKRQSGQGNSAKQ